MPTFVTPAGEEVSGGNVYNARVLATWPGPAPTHLALPGDWPDGAGTAATLARALEHRRGDVVLVDGLVGAAHPDVLAAAEEAGTRVTLLVHLPLPDETGVTEERRQALAAVERRSVGVCSFVVATSRTAARDIADRYGRPDIAIAAPGADLGDESRGSTPPHVLCLASLTPRKNHLGLTEALRRITHLDWTATFAGPGEVGHRAAVEGALTAAGIADRVEVPGTVTGAALDRLWARTDVLVLPSVAETYGLVVTEAIAHGVPVVVTDGTGAAEALSDGPGPDPGLVVDAHDPAALAVGIATVLAHPGYAAFARARRLGLRSWAETAATLAALIAPDEDPTRS